MAVFTINWCRIEGNPIPDLKKEYGSFINLPIGQKIFYGTPEIQINNPFNLINGCIYKIVNISEFGYNTIKEIDNNYALLQNQIQSYDKTIDIDHGAIYYYEPFTVDRSCLIFHADGTKKIFDHVTIILIDQHATPEIIAITGKYKGSSVAIGNTFDNNLIDLIAIYADGNKSKIIDNYEIIPSNRIITNLGSNVIQLNYTTPTNKNLSTSIIIEGVKNLIKIKATYDGPNVGIDKEVERRFLIVTAEYSDTSTSIINNYTFVEGSIVTENNKGVLRIHYKGFYTNVTIPMYSVATSRLMAYYNGPNIELNNEFNINDCKIKIYYASSDGKNDRYENINPELCEFSHKIIEHEGINHIIVSFNGKAGKVTTTMIVNGIKQKVKLNFIEAEYIGSPIKIGTSFSLEKILCKAYYSDGSIVYVKNFKINSNVINIVGINEFRVEFKDKNQNVFKTISVKGVEKDTTTKNNIYSLNTKTYYPEAIKTNNRERGPAESIKQKNTEYYIKTNINELKNIFNNIDKKSKIIINSIYENIYNKTNVINKFKKISETEKEWNKDNRFYTGKYAERNE